MGMLTESAVGKLITSELEKNRAVLQLLLAEQKKTNQLLEAMRAESPTPEGMGL